MTEIKPEFRPIDRSEHELLIIDDNPASRYATVRQLRSAGFRTREAANGAEGLAADVTMLIGNGYVPGHAAFAVDLLRRVPAVRALFEARIAGH